MVLNFHVVVDRRGNLSTTFANLKHLINNWVSLTFANWWFDAWMDILDRSKQICRKVMNKYINLSLWDLASETTIAQKQLQQHICTYCTCTAITSCQLIVILPALVTLSTSCSTDCSQNCRSYFPICQSKQATALTNGNVSVWQCYNQ